MTEKERIITPAALKALTENDIPNFIAASTPGGIEAQEAQGQRDLCASARLPIEIRQGGRKDFEAVGIRFGKKVDDLFIEATLPRGWKLEPTEHSMWSNLIDDRGKIFARVFYKAAFYDRRAIMNLDTDWKPK